MGWGSGTNAAGREVGYLIDAECDKDTCTEGIDRGLSQVCGGMHDGGDRGCGGYFCDSHLVLDYPHGGFICEACWTALSGREANQ